MALPARSPEERAALNRMAEVQGESAARAVQRQARPRQAQEKPPAQAPEVAERAEGPRAPQQRAEGPASAQPQAVAVAVAAAWAAAASERSRGSQPEPAVGVAVERAGGQVLEVAVVATQPQASDAVSAWREEAPY